MLKGTNLVLGSALVAAASSVPGNANDEKRPAASPRDQTELGRSGLGRPASGREQSVQFLLLVETGADGTISKQEWMQRMEQEFYRLDTDKNGVVDTREVAQSNLPVVHISIALRRRLNDLGWTRTVVSGGPPSRRLAYHPRNKDSMREI